MLSTTFGYILVAAAVTFGLRVLCIKWDVRDQLDDPVVIAPIVCGMLWPVAAPIYFAYIAAKRFMDNHNV